MLLICDFDYFSISDSLPIFSNLTRDLVGNLNEEYNIPGLVDAIIKVYLFFIMLVSFSLIFFNNNNLMNLLLRC
jgi:hypothetical protein